MGGGVSTLVEENSPRVEPNEVTHTVGSTVTTEPHRYQAEPYINANNANTTPVRRRSSKPPANIIVNATDVSKASSSSVNRAVNTDTGGNMVMKSPVYSKDYNGTINLPSSSQTAQSHSPIYNAVNRNLTMANSGSGIPASQIKPQHVSTNAPHISAVTAPSYDQSRPNNVSTPTGPIVMGPQGIVNNRQFFGPNTPAYSTQNIPPMYTNQSIPQNVQQIAPPIRLSTKQLNGPPNHITNNTAIITSSKPNALVIKSNVPIPVNAGATGPTHISAFTVKETHAVKRNRASLPQQLTHAQPTTGDWLNKRYIVNNYILLDILGEGSYAEVRLCKERTSDSLFAIKIISKDLLSKKKGGSNSETFFDDIRREIAIMKKLLHPNVLRLFEVLDDPKVNKLYLGN